MFKGFKGFILLILLLNFPEVIGEGVYIDNEYVFLSADPMTLGSSGWVVFIIRSKVYEGPIDVCWGFNFETANPLHPQIWRNYTHELTKIEEVPINETHSDYQKVVYYETYPDWKKWQADFTVKNIEISGFDKWFLLRSVNIEKDREYKVRVWVEVPFSGLTRSEGQYLFAVKPSGLSLQEAKQQDKLFILDPWWDTAWDYRVKLTFNNSASSENLTDFPVLIKLNSSRINFSYTQEDGDDLRLVESDDSTVLSYEIECFNKTEQKAVIHAKTPQVDAGSTSDYAWLYYGNPTASSNEDPAGVWSNGYVLVQHLQEPTNTTAYDSTGYDNDGISLPPSSPPIKVDGVVDGAKDFIAPALGGDYIDCGNDSSLNPTEEITVSAWINQKTHSTTNYKYIAGKGINYNNEPYMLVATQDQLWRFAVWDGSIQRYREITSHLNEWHLLTGVFGSTYIQIYDNGELKRQDTFTSQGIAVEPHDVTIGSCDNGGSRYFNGTIDEVRISNVTRSADWVEASYLSMTDQFIQWSSTTKVPWRFNLQVLDELGDSISGCIVQISNATHTFTDNTNSTGFISEQEIRLGDYTLTIAKDNYITYELLFNIDRNIYWVVKLFTIEEGSVIFLDIPLLVLASLGTVFMLLGWMSREPGKGATGSALGFLFWGVTAFYWLYQHHGTNLGLFAWVFMAPFSICLFMTWEHVLAEAGDAFG